jgi:hypothetical protein
MRQTPSITLLKSICTACLILAANRQIPVVFAAVPQSPAAPLARLSYADLADLTTGAPFVAKAAIEDVVFLRPEQSAGVRPGHRRAFVRARVGALIRGEGGIAPVISYLYDVPLDARGKPPKLRKRQVLIFARGSARPGDVQLVAPDAQIDWTPGTEASVRAIAAEALAAAPPPRITDVGDAFHVAGTIAGEGETQIFLRTETGQPVSLSIIRRPGTEPGWAVALGEIVDEAAGTPRPGTLLWYRLACGLPQTLPDRAVRTLPVADAEAARADYQLVLKGLGACGRTRGRSL